MKTVRNSVFETNSSSMHTITIPSHKPQTITAADLPELDANNDLIVELVGDFETWDDSFNSSFYNKLQYIAVASCLNDDFNGADFDYYKLKWIKQPTTTSRCKSMMECHQKLEQIVRRIYDEVAHKPFGRLGLFYRMAKDDETFDTHDFIAYSDTAEVGMDGVIRSFDFSSYWFNMDFPFDEDDLYNLLMRKDAYIEIEEN